MLYSIIKLISKERKLKRKSGFKELINAKLAFFMTPNFSRFHSISLSRDKKIKHIFPIDKTNENVS
jgi:hypothetical protein